MNYVNTSNATKRRRESTCIQTKVHPIDWIQMQQNGQDSGKKTYGTKSGVIGFDPQ